MDSTCYTEINPLCAIMISYFHALVSMYCIAPAKLLAQFGLSKLSSNSGKKNRLPVQTDT